MTLKIYNVMTRQKQEFVPLTPGAVKMYACGITVSADAHIGHAYQSVVFDVITRYFAYLGYNVKYVRNYTDVDDKIIANANKIGENPISFAERYMAKTDAEMDALGNNRPTVMARATQCIDDIIAFVQKLIDSGHAYVSEFGDVYFKLSSFPDYGKLSHIQTNKNEIGVRKDIEPGKLDEADFALWKSAKPDEIYWDSPWGRGRPGWHIECSAMNMKCLGEQIDIHGGGRDLVFPHHENEIAQTESVTGKTFANYWVHCGLVKVNGQKMSKSLNNGILLQDVLAQYDSDVIRFALLNNMYSNDIDITDTFFPNAMRHVYKMYSVINAARAREYSDANADKTGEKTQQITDEFRTAMDDNFNTYGVIVAAFQWFDFVSAELAKKHTEYDLKTITEKIIELFGVFNILQRDAAQYIADARQRVLTQNNISADEIQAKIDARATAKAARDYATADAIRGELLTRGVTLMDSPSGTTWDIAL